MSGPVDDARLAELQRLSDEMQSPDWRAEAIEAEIGGRFMLLAYCVPDLLAELSRLRAEHNQQAQRIEATLDQQSIYDIVTRTVHYGEANKITREMYEYLLAALVPVQHPSKENDHG